MFKNRSYQKELIDADQLQDSELDTTLIELHNVNRLLGGYATTFNALNKVNPKGKTIVDIGCGGGDMVLKIHEWATKYKQSMQVFGLDIKTYCIERSKKLVEGTDIQFIQSDYRKVFEEIPDAKIVHACLFTHHLGEVEIIELIKMCQKKGATLIVNDLIRNPVAYYAIKVITSLFSNSYLVKNDAPLSVLRGFKKGDWLNMIESSGAKKYSITSRWAFRHQVIVYA